MVKQSAIFATVIGLTLTVAAPKAKAFETFLDPVLEIGSAYVFLQQTYYDLETVYVAALDGYYYSNGDVVYNPTYAYLTAYEAADQMNVVYWAQRSLYRAYNSLNNWDFVDALQQLVDALVGANSGRGLIFSNTIDANALLASWENGAGLEGAPGASWTYSWYALWLTYYAYLDLYSLVLYDYQGSGSSSGSSSGSAHQNAGTINDN